MDNTTNIGRLHLGFFDHSHLFKRLEVQRNNKGEVAMLSPFFALNYDYNTGILSGDDMDVVLDFADLIKKNYGSNITRKEFTDKLSWDMYDEKHSVLNVGVCMLPDSIVGWDGTINSVWFDADRPGDVVGIHFQYWSKRMLNGAWKLDRQDVDNLGGKEVVLPNLLDAVKYTDTSKMGKINKLLREVS